jgi:hypothetical protein
MRDSFYTLQNSLIQHLQLSEFYNRAGVAIGDNNDGLRMFLTAGPNKLFINKNFQFEISEKAGFMTQNEYRCSHNRCQCRWPA